jgi:Restriction endonuclease fold toxin 7
LSGRKVSWGAVGGAAVGGCVSGLLFDGAFTLIRPLWSTGSLAAKSGMAGVRAAGRTGEEVAGVVKNTEHIPSVSGSATYRIPDELNSSLPGEVKNVSRLSYTNQLRDFSAYASGNGLQFNLYVRSGTQLSRPLQLAVDSGTINLIRNLP